MSRVLDLIRSLTANASTNDVTATNAPVRADNSKKVATTDWLLDLFSGTGQHVITQNGYQKLPGGVIIQWGLATVAAGNNTVTLPLAFPTSMFTAVATQSSPFGVGLTVNNIITVSNFTVSNFNIASNVPGGVYWIAIGI